MLHLRMRHIGRGHHICALAWYYMQCLTGPVWPVSVAIAAILINVNGAAAGGPELTHIGNPAKFGHYFTVTLNNISLHI